MSYSFEPIGFLKGGGQYPQEAPHQSTLAVNVGCIELLPGLNFETAVADLAGFDRIWVLFVFDRNHHWKPKVRPPVGGLLQRIGVFATRSPHRPNPIGLSAVELVGVEGRKLYIRNFDLLDNTPILDIKPYIPAVDAFPASAAGWRDAVPEPFRQLTLHLLAEKQVIFLREHGGPDLANVARVQITTRELDPKHQRLRPLSDSVWELAFRTWRLKFFFPGAPAENRVELLEIYSGYLPEELLPGTPDPYHDKELHRLYSTQF